MHPSAFLVPIVAGALALAAPRSATGSTTGTDSLLTRVLPADSLRALALQYAGKRDSALALVHATRLAYQGHPDARVRLRAIQIEGTVRANAGDGLGAVPLLSTAIRMAETRRDTASLVRALRFRAYAHGVLGQLDLDAADANRMLRLARLSRDRRAEPYALSLLGWVERARGHLAAAHELLLASVRGFRALDNDAGEAYTLVMLGSVEMALGRYDDARRTYRRSLELGHTVPLAWAEPQAFNDLGVAEAEVGAWDKAMDYFARAYRMEVAHGQLQDAVMTLQNLVEARFSIGATDGASELVRDGVAQCEHAGMRRQRGGLLGVLGTIESQRGRLADADRAFRRALATSDTLGALERSSVVLRYSELLFARDSIPAVTALLQNELAARGTRTNLETELEQRLQLGRALALQSRPTEARTQFELVARRAGAAGLASEEQQAAIRLASLEDALGRPAAAGRWLDHATAVWERRRVVNSRAVRELDLTFGGAALGCQSAFHHLRHDPPATAAAAAFDVLQRFRARTLLERAAGLRPLAAADSARLAPRYVTLSELQRQVLRPREVLVEFDFAPSFGLLSVVTSNECRVVAIPGADSIARAIQLGLDLVRDPAASATSANAVLSPLAHRVFDAAGPEIRSAREITLIAGGPVQGLPLEALLGSLGMRSVAITRVPSATLLALIRRRPEPGAAAAPMLALAGGGRVPRAELEGARREVHAFATRYANVREASGDSPSAPTGAAALARYGLLHFAGHSRAESERPWRSGFVVRAASDPADEIVLRAEDIARQPLRATFVALASCASADSRPGSAEGMTSLTGAFLAAGSRAVLATLWDVDDRTTERFMLSFYGRLAQGLTAAAALTATREEFRRGAGTELPFFWAGYVLNGEGGTRVALAEKGVLPGRRGD